MHELFAILVLTASVTARDRGNEVALARAIGDRQPQRPVTCIDPTLTTSTEVVEGTAIVYRQVGRVYVNRTLGNAAALHRDSVLVTQIIGSQLCRLDPVTLLQPPSRLPSGVVVLGDFIPYIKR